MPPASPRRQPARSADLWFRRDTTRRLLHEVQRQVVPELTRVFGRSGLYLRPSDDVSPTLSGNLLAGVVSLARDGDGFGGDVACSDERLPFASGSLSLVYALFVFETSPAPHALLEEIARVLEPEGMAILLTLNPWSLARAELAGVRACAMPVSSCSACGMSGRSGRRRSASTSNRTVPAARRRACGWRT